MKIRLKRETGDKHWFEDDVSQNDNKQKVDLWLWIWKNTESKYCGEILFVQDIDN